MTPFATYRRVTRNLLAAQPIWAGITVVVVPLSDIRELDLPFFFPVRFEVLRLPPFLPPAGLIFNDSHLPQLIRQSWAVRGLYT